MKQLRGDVRNAPIVIGLGVLLAFASIAKESQEAPHYYEDLFDQVLGDQSVENVKLLDKALQTPSNHFEYPSLTPFHKLSAREPSFKLYGFDGSKPRKKLREDIASKLMLVDIVKASDLYRSFEFDGKKIRENPREISNMSGPLLSFFYYDAYKMSNADKDELLEEAILSRFNEQSAKRKLEIVDPQRAKVLSNCDDKNGTPSVTIVAMSALPNDNDSTLDLVTHHFVFEETRSFIKRKVGLGTSPQAICEAYVKDLNQALDSAKINNALYVLKAEGASIWFDEIPRFNMGEFADTCKSEVEATWRKAKIQVELAMPLKDESGADVIQEYKEAIVKCRELTKAEQLSIANRQVEVANLRQQAINNVNLHSNDNDDWSRNYTRVIQDPRYQVPRQINTNTSLALAYKEYHPPKNESSEEREQRLADAKAAQQEIALNREKKAEEARLLAEQRLLEEKQYMEKKTEWNKQWLEAYRNGISGFSGDFSSMMRTINANRLNVETEFLGRKENAALARAKARIELRESQFKLRAYTPSQYKASSIPKNHEEAKELSMRREAELFALMERTKEHQAYLSNHSTIAFPSHLNENERYDYLMRYLDQLEKDSFESEYARIKKLKEKN
ncbi:MAG: hypothetical protein R3A80_12090 [Bdellovibrionota bacterium]